MQSETQCTLYKPLLIHLQTSKSIMHEIEYIVLIVIPAPLALMTYLVTGYYTTATPAVVLAFILFVFVCLAFLITTPTQHFTALGLTLQLTGISVCGILHDFKDLRAPIYVLTLSLCVFVYWVLSVYMLLSIRGVTREQMGRLGEMANGVGVVTNGIGVGVGLISKGVGIICCGASGDPRDVGAEVRRPPYDFSPFIDMPNSKLPAKPFLRDRLVAIICGGDSRGRGDPGVQACPSEYQFSPFTDTSDSDFKLLKPNLV